MKHNNVNRYVEFCQFRREIRGSVEYVIVGIDVAKERHHAFFGTASGQALLKRLLFDNNAGGFGELLECVGQLKTRHGLSKAVFALFLASGHREKIISPEFQELSVHERILGG